MAPRRTIDDLDMDSLVNCSNYLDLKDISNMAITSKYMKSFAYSDHVWRILFRKRWPSSQMSSTVLQSASMREAYMARNVSVQQFKFDDPQSGQFEADSSFSTNLLLNKDDIILSQDSSIIMKKDAFLFGSDPILSLRNHNARITCMRMFPLCETSLFRSDNETRSDVLVTSSCDHTIRLWWKGRCQRCYRGHSGPVTTLADQLLGDTSTSGKVLASGGEDGTIRLWSLTSSGKRGEHALKSTFHGHGKAITFLSVAGHTNSLLVSISKDAKVRVWDPARSSSSLSHASGCIGMTAAPVGNSGSKSCEPIGLKCHESLMYVATGSLVTAIDVRTMRYVFTCATQPQLCSFQMLPSQSLICTGGHYKAMLWDIRKSQEKPEPITEFDHIGEVEHLHIDSFKVVTGSVRSSDINVWDPKTGVLLNTLKCHKPESPNFLGGCSALAVKGSRIVIASLDRDIGLGYVFYKDYTHTSTPSISSSKNVSESKLWRRQTDYFESDDYDSSESDDGWNIQEWYWG